MSSTIELEKTEEIPKLDLGEPKPKRKYVKKVKVVEVDLTPKDSALVAEEKQSQPKEKKPRSEAQQKAFEKCLESKRLKSAQRKEERTQVMEEKLMKAEDKIVKTGIKLQKKALIQLAIEEGDDIDIPDEIVKKVLKRRASKKQPVTPSVPSHTPPQSPSRKFSFIDN
jgi:hypothetical protein